MQKNIREIHVIGGQFQSKTLTVKNKNKIFPEFLSPSITMSYRPRAQKNNQNFGSKLHIRLIIEGVFFYSLSLPAAAGLPSMLAHLLPCRGLLF